MIEDELRRCREELSTLAAENRDLRRAAIAFGRLAERLNVQLVEERRRQIVEGQHASLAGVMGKRS